jgi:hypothetical protein
MLQNSTGGQFVAQVAALLGNPYDGPHPPTTLPACHPLRIGGLLATAA